MLFGLFCLPNIFGGNLKLIRSDLVKHTTRPITFLHCFLAFLCKSFSLLTQAYFRSSLRYLLLGRKRGGGGVGKGGWGTLLYEPNRYVPPQRVWFLRLFGLKNGIDFTPFWFGTMGVFQMSKKEGQIC